jgi:hypothetical protein
LVPEDRVTLKSCIHDSKLLGSIQTLSTLIIPSNCPIKAGRMEKRTLKQWIIEDKLAKLAQWKAKPDWLPTEAAKNLDVSKGTLMGWKSSFLVISRLTWSLRDECGSLVLEASTSWGPMSWMCWPNTIGD